MDAAVPATVALSTTFLIAVFCYFKCQGSWRWPPVVAGVCLGVSGASTIIGQLARTIINIGIKAVTGIDNAF